MTAKKPAVGRQLVNLFIFRLGGERFMKKSLVCFIGYAYIIDPTLEEIVKFLVKIVCFL